MAPKVPIRVGVDLSICAFNSAGNARYAQSLLAALHERAGCDTTIVPLSMPTPVRVSAGVQRKLLVLFWEFVYVPHILPQRCRLQRCDLLHLTAPAPLHAGTTPVVATVHDLTPVLFPQWFPTIMGMRLRRWTTLTLRHSTAIIAVSQSTAADVARVQLPKPAPVYPVYSASFLDSPTKQVVPRDTPYILSVGTLEPRKNLLAVLEAYRSLRTQTADAPRLVVVGARGWMIKNIATEARRLDIDQHITLAGFVSDAELQTLYAHATMLVYPSLYEGFGFPVLEAMSSGCPVITSRVSSLPEIAGSAALLVDPQDTVQLAVAMRRVLAEPGLAQRMRVAGHRRAQLFTWSRCADETLRVYAQTLR